MPRRQYHVTMRKLEQLRHTLCARERWCLVVQNSPDPDALASAWALAFLAQEWDRKDSRIVSGGRIGRAENRAMCRYLRMKVEQAAPVHFSGRYGIALVDTQPGTGNNVLPDHVCADIVIDHHPVKDACKDTAFTDIRPYYGANSTLLTQYIRKAELKPDTTLATALLYGIKSDTRNLGRGGTKADVEVYQWLNPLADTPLLAKIEFTRLPQQYFKNLLNAITKARIYNWLIVSTIGDVSNPEMVAEAADILLRCEGIRWVLCAGYCGNVLHFSLRAHDPTKNAGRVMERIIGQLGTGGGHAQMAGAQIPIESLSVGRIDRIVGEVLTRLLDALKVEDTAPLPLIPEHDTLPDLLRVPAEQNEDDERAERSP